MKLARSYLGFCGKCKKDLRGSNAEKVGFCQSCLIEMTETERRRLGGL